MDAIIGRYRLRMEETGLLLTHEAGIIFDMTPGETLGLLNFIIAYRENLETVEVETAPRLKRILVEEGE
ncbi:MAG: hypothetical protein E6J44_07960 [Chloroflexi bacterium]|nr:MAG: hypothetical protein E6J44_07960 [Chloroflexota bacterium]